MVSDVASAAALYSDAQAAIGAFVGGAGLDTAAAAAAAFGVSGAALAQAVGAFQRKGWSSLEIVDEEVLDGARGAYSIAADTIYLSRQFLTSAGSAAVTSVLIEEIGHAIDARVNSADPGGDEGEIFAQFVLGQATDDSVAALKAQDDHGSIDVDGNAVAVEFASTSVNGAKVGIVYSATTAARYWSTMAYSQLFMNAQSQAAMAGVPFDILSESDLTNTALLQQYDALIFPSMRNVQASQVTAIVNSLTAASQAGVGIIASGEFLSNSETGAAIGGDPYARMESLLGVRPQTWSSGATSVALTAGDVTHPVMSDYASGEVIHNYSAAWWTAFQAVAPATVLATQTSGGVARPAVITTTSSGGGRNVHFSDDAILADHNLLWQAIDHAVNGSGITAGLQLSRNASIVASRVDMDQAQETADVNPASGAGIYDVLLPIVQQWKTAYNYVASYYVDIGNNPPDQQTDWSISRPYYAELLALGNELGSHSITHPHNTNALTPAQIQFEFEQSRDIIQQQMSITVDGAAVPGNPENLTTALAILQYYEYLSGGFSGVGAGYTDAFGYLNPAMAGADKVYLAPNVSFDFSLVEFQGLTADQAAARWQQELAKLGKHADVPIFLWPWHDYGPTDWDYDAAGDQSPYNTAMFTDFISKAYNAGAEFVTLDDLAERISSFDDSALSWSRPNATTVTATVTSSNAGKLALDLDNLGTQKIASVANWYAYDDDSMFLDRDGGSFTVTLGATPANVTRITALPMRAELVSLSGDGNNLTFRVIGEGDVTIDLASLAGKTLSVSGATIQSQSGEIVVLDVGENGTHDVTVTLSTSTENSAPVITSNGGGSTAALSIGENTTAVTTVTATDPDTGQTRTFSIAGGADAARFSINATTGVLAFVSAPDFEAPTDSGSNNRYEVIVTVADNGSPSLNDTQAITVNVTDVAGQVINGDASANTLVGGAEDDIISGLGGNDTLSGLGGNDTLVGGTNDDVLNGGAGADRLNGSGGTDTVSYGESPDRAFVRLWVGDAWGGDATGDSFLSIENLRGSANADWFEGLRSTPSRLEGLGSDDALFGFDANDTLLGGDGADRLRGGGGRDVLNGGNGSDTASYEGSLSRVFVRLWAGDNWGGDAEGDMIASVENLVGSENPDWFEGLRSVASILEGRGSDDALFGFDANDALLGGDGSDWLRGGGGGDVLDGGNGRDTASYEGSTSRVFVRLWVGDSWGGDAAGDSFTSVEDLVASAHADWFEGLRTGASTLDGRDGDDTLYGFGFADTLLGGAGNDWLVGGGGADLLSGGSGRDFLVYTSIEDRGDTITDFTRGSGNDVLDIADVLVRYDPVSSNISNFVRLTQSGSSTTVSINVDGIGSDFVDLAILQNNTGLLLNEMLAQGNLVVT